MENINNIFLIGMMGSGKSSIAKILSNKLNMQLCDTDNEIQLLSDMSILQIFNKYGEKKFRQMEKRYFIEMAKQNNIIFATGGGIILDQESRVVLVNKGLTFFLDTSIELLLNRIKNSLDRPLLSNANKSKVLCELYKDRMPYYKSSCHYTINTDLFNPEEIANQIINKYNNES